MNIKGNLQTMQQPAAPTWNELAPAAIGGMINVHVGAVQVIGRTRFGIEDDAFTIPIPLLLTLAGQVMTVLCSPTPEGHYLRQLLAQAQAQQVKGD